VWRSNREDLKKDRDDPWTKFPSNLILCALGAKKVLLHVRCQPLMSSVYEKKGNNLPRKLKALSSNPSTAQKSGEERTKRPVIPATLAAEIGRINVLRPAQAKSSSEPNSTNKPGMALHICNYSYWGRTGRRMEASPGQ
jgi:hypothetical protein